MSQSKAVSAAESTIGAPAASNAMWGGRFATAPAEIMQHINVSIGFDRKLAAQDVAVNRAHARMLGSVGILSAADVDAIQGGFDAIEAELAAGSFPFREAYEDIHMNLEARLKELIGEPAGRLHTARSRNDQVATSFRLWVRAAIDRHENELRDLQAALLDQAEAGAETIMPGFTHLQLAQPVTFGHHLMAYVEMLGRDRARLQDARARLNEMPLGAAALAGTGFPIDRDMTALALGFDRPMSNSMDAVSDRDFALDYLAASSIIAMHLSRLAEELVLWSSDTFRFIRLSDAFSTGSSIMPQKRNPDAAELVRGRSGRIYGALMSLLVMLKALPLSYNKDMQEDKEPVFETAHSVSLCLAAMTGMIRDLQPCPDQMKAAAGRGFSTATDLADWLVREAGLPFREAHHVTGRIVRLAEDKGCILSEVPLADMQAVSPLITESVYKVLTLEASVASRCSFGGTAPSRVREAIAVARKKYL